MNTTTSSRPARWLAHELGNYLAALRTNLNLLYGRGEDIPSRDRPRWERVLNSCEKLEAMTKDMLQLGKEADTDSQPPLQSGFRTVDLPTLVKRICLREFSDAFGSILFSRAGASGRQVFGNETLLEGAFSNLFRNAFAAGATRIEVDFRLLAGKLAVSVEDNGHGCGEEILDKIFEDDFTTKKDGAGLGMGLVREIVHAHGGEITAFSKNVLGNASGLIILLSFPIKGEGSKPIKP